MANRKASASDANGTASSLVRKATGSTRQNGEDLIGDPKLKKAFQEAKKRAAKKP